MLPCDYKTTIINSN